MTPEGSCILCGSSDPELLFKDRDRSGQAEGEFSAVKCRNCGLIYTLPNVAIEDVRGFYPDECYDAEKDGPVPGINRFEARFSRYYSRLLWKMLFGAQFLYGAAAFFFIEAFLFGLKGNFSFFADGFFDERRLQQLD